MERYDWLVEIFEEKVPFNRLIGLKVAEIAQGTVLIHVPFSEGLIGDFRRPALHGGVLSACADVAGGVAVWSEFSPEDAVSTIDLRVDYLRPGAKGDLWCRGEVLRSGNRVAVTTMTLYQDSPDIPIAVARGAYNIRRHVER